MLSLYYFLFLHRNELKMTMTTKIQPTTITEKLAATMQTALLAPAKKYDMHHNIRIQITTKHNYKEHIPGKHYYQPQQSNPNQLSNHHVQNFMHEGFHDHTS